MYRQLTIIVENFTARVVLGNIATPVGKFAARR
jgi:hypothetical protein